MKKYLLIISAIVLLFSACTNRTYISEEVIYSVDGNTETVIETETNLSGNSAITDEKELINSVIAYAHTLEGTPYKWGGTTPAGFDCSGFVQHVYAHSGVKIPRMTDDMVAMSKKVDIKNVKPGDLVFFKGSNINSSKIGHVALVISASDGDFKMIHATSKGVLVNTFSEYDYWKTRYLFATRFDTGILRQK